MNIHSIFQHLSSLTHEDVTWNCLLLEFDLIFQEPCGLPPPDACGHRIILLPETPRTFVRLYLCPHFQKDETGKHVLQ